MEHPWCKWKDLIHCSSGPYLLRSMTEGDTWQEMKPLLLGQIPPQHTVVRELCLDCSEVLFIILLCFTLSHRNNKPVLTDTRQQAACLTPTPSKLAKAKLFLSITSTRKSLQMIFWWGCGTDWAQGSLSVSHSHTELTSYTAEGGETPSLPKAVTGSTMQQENYIRQPVTLAPMCCYMMPQHAREVQ